MADAEVSSLEDDMAVGDDIGGIVLAAGRSRRMGQDKASLSFQGQPLLAHAIRRARPQLRWLALNITDAQRPDCKGYQLPLLADSMEGFLGPLAGILTGMQWLQKQHPEAVWLASFAVDAPFFPLDLVRRLKQRALAGDHLVVMAESAGRRHPVFALWRVSLCEKLQIALDQGVRKIEHWTAPLQAVAESFPVDGEGDPFFNLNRPQDLEQGRHMAPASCAVPDKDSGDEKASLPDMATLDYDSDYSPFLSAEVEEKVRNMALRRLFSNPLLNISDGLDVYDGDYTAFEPLKDIITAEMRVRDSWLQSLQKIDPTHLRPGVQIRQAQEATIAAEKAVAEQAEQDPSTAEPATADPSMATETTADPSTTEPATAETVGDRLVDGAGTDSRASRASKRF